MVLSPPEVSDVNSGLRPSLKHPRRFLMERETEERQGSRVSVKQVIFTLPEFRKSGERAT